MIDMEIIEIKNHRELPKGVEMVLYEPPFYDAEPIEEAVDEFRRKYGSEPQTIYQIRHQLYVVKP
jgi:hypothetical protein